MADDFQRMFFEHLMADPRIRHLWEHKFEQWGWKRPSIHITKDFWRLEQLDPAERELWAEQLLKEGWEKP